MTTIVFKSKEINALFRAVNSLIDDWYFKTKKLINVDDMLNGNCPMMDDEYLEDFKDRTGKKNGTKADAVKDHLTEDWGVECHKALSKLAGFQIKFTQKGEHHHDGQLVEYIIDLVSPNGKKTKISELMCLGVGFEAQEEVEVKV